MLESLEESGAHLQNNATNNNNTKFINNNVSTQPAKVFHSRPEQNSNSTKNIECIICESAHHFAQCPQFKSKTIS